LACHLQIDADVVLDPAYHFDADPDVGPDPDVDPDLDYYLMRMRIQATKMMQIHADTDSGSTTLLIIWQFLINVEFSILIY
jgi:hypothetical protein